MHLLLNASNQCNANTVAFDTCKTKFPLTFFTVLVQSSWGWQKWKLEIEANPSRNSLPSNRRAGVTARYFPRCIHSHGKWRVMHMDSDLWESQIRDYDYTFISLGFRPRFKNVPSPKSLCFILLAKSCDFQPGTWRWCQDVNMSIGIYYFWKSRHFQGMCSGSSTLALRCPLEPLKSSMSLSDLLLLSLWHIFSILKHLLLLFSTLFYDFLCPRLPTGITDCLMNSVWLCIQVNMEGNWYNSFLKHLVITSINFVHFLTVSHWNQ